MVIREGGWWWCVGVICVRVDVTKVVLFGQYHSTLSTNSVCKGEEGKTLKRVFMWSVLDGFEYHWYNR